MDKISNPGRETREGLRVRNSLQVVFMIFLATFFLAAPSPVHAQNEADLALDVVVDPSGIAPPGTLGTITLTVTNLGPGATLATHQTVIESNEFVITLEYLQAMAFANAGECDFSFFFLDPPPGGDLRVVFFFFFSEPLAPGESRVCEGLYQINSMIQAPTVENTWTVFNLSIDDPDPTNNEVTLFFQVFPPVTDIPTLSPAGWVLLCVTLLTSFVVITRRWAGRAAEPSA
jgi:hypothetical protein